MSECVRYLDDLKAYADRELSPLRRRAVARHVAECAQCRSDLAAMQRIGQELRVESIPPLSPELRARLIAAGPAPAPSRKPVVPRWALTAGSFAILAVIAFLFRPGHESFIQSNASRARTDADYFTEGGSGSAAAPQMPKASSLANPQFARMSKPQANPGPSTDLSSRISAKAKKSDLGIRFSLAPSRSAAEPADHAPRLNEDSSRDTPRELSSALAPRSSNRSSIADLKESRTSRQTDKPTSPARLTESERLGRGAVASPIIASAGSGRQGADRRFAGVAPPAMDSASGRNAAATFGVDAAKTEFHESRDAKAGKPVTHVADKQSLPADPNGNLGTLKLKAPAQPANQPAITPPAGAVSVPALSATASRFDSIKPMEKDSARGRAPVASVQMRRALKPAAPNDWSASTASSATGNKGLTQQGTRNSPDQMASKGDGGRGGSGRYFSDLYAFGQNGQQSPRPGQSAQVGTRAGGQAAAGGLGGFGGGGMAGSSASALNGSAGRKAQTSDGVLSQNGASASALPTIHLDIAVENLAKKRADVGQIAKESNGMILEGLNSQRDESTVHDDSITLHVSKDSVPAVLDKLHKLGDLTEEPLELQQSTSLGIAPNKAGLQFQRAPMPDSRMRGQREGGPADQNLIGREQKSVRANQRTRTADDFGRGSMGRLIAIIIRLHEKPQTGRAAAEKRDQNPPRKP